MEPRIRDRTDRALLAEIVLALALLTLALFFYWRPAAEGELAPRWWQWVLMGTLFFGIAGIHTSRIRQRRHRTLHREIREEAAEAQDR